MKRLFYVAIATALSTAVAQRAQAATEEKFSTYDLPTSTLHVYQSGDPMGDVSFIVEGDKSLVIIEQPTFYFAIEEFGEYVEGLEKPIDKVVASYHSGGLAQYKRRMVTMPEAMIPFMESPMAQGMIANFTEAFGESADFRKVEGVKGYAVPSTQEWAGVNFVMSAGAKSDFPAASIQIDGDAFYTHVAPAKAHISAMQLRSVEAIDAMLAELEKIHVSGAKYIFGSHGLPATMEDVEFQIEYLNRVKELRAVCGDSDIFAQRLIVAYPGLSGAEGVKSMAKSLYPDEVECAEKEAVRARVQDYFDTVSNLDMELARDLWAESDNISLIAPLSHNFGFDQITNGFLLKAFSHFQSRKLSS